MPRRNLEALVLPSAMTVYKPMRHRSRVGGVRDGGLVMTFDAILEQVITLLKRQGRVSYSALRRRFGIDEAYLNDLKEEILYVHPVIDDEGRGLIWTGEIEEKSVTMSPTHLSLNSLLNRPNPSKSNRQRQNRVHRTLNVVNSP